MSVIGSVLLDTSVIVPYLRFNDPQLDEKFAEGNLLYVSYTVIGELYYGAYSSINPQQSLLGVKDFLSFVETLPMDEEVTDHYGDIKASLRKRGTPIPENDIWIAASARRHGIDLVTHDNHFKLIHDLETLSW